MFTFTVLLILVIAVLLILIILVQNAKGGGLINNMGNTHHVMSSHRTINWVEKATWTLAVLMLVLSISTVIWVSTDSSNATISSPNVKKAKEEDDLTLPTLSSPLDSLNGNQNDKLIQQNNTSKESDSIDKE